MKRAFMISFAGLAIAAAGFGQTSNSWFEQWHRAKYGRYSPMEEARQKATQESTAFREETATQPASRTESGPNSWREQWFKAKYGRYSPMEEARQKAEGRQ